MGKKKRKFHGQLLDFWFAEANGVAIPEKEKN